MSSTRSPLTLLRMTARNLYRRPVRTSLTAIGVAMGVVAIVAFTTIADGLWESVEEFIHLDDSDLLVFQANVAGDILSALDERETHETLLRVPGVAKAVGTLWHVLPVEKQLFVMLIGLHRAEMSSRHENLVRGRCPEADDELLLGTIAQRVLAKDVGDTLNILDEPCRVVGIFHSDLVFINGAVVMDLPRLQRIAAREGYVTAFQVYLDSEADPDGVIARIEAENPGLVAIGDVRQYSKVDQGLEMMDSMVWGISFIALVVGSIIVANTMWMSVSERTREIGVLRAVGWSRRQIVLMILLEAAGVGLIACALGSAGGTGLAKLTTRLEVADRFMDPVFGVSPFALALLVAVVLSVLGALMPAWRAAHISPAEALRYE